ncbi:serine hydrolase domain-containing protein [Pseudonocardia sp. CA-107938]|uniref:serine hydrolase domain-containing protein n=1 Tax=Pseudonocardia sp. CA-107938 TaxID=3240021 RepID=UPI003D911B8B
MIPTDLRSWLDDEVPALRREFGVPGCAVGVLTPDGVLDTADGVLNLRTGAPVTTESLFQVGSITKLWTATLILQLVEDGLLDLDAPVASVLPGFRVADAAASAAITTRQLLTHTSGVLGDAFVPTSRGDDAVARYVDEVVPGLPQDVPPGAGLSYSNSGYVILGRIAEVLRGRPFHELLAERIAGPLGLEHWAALPEQALLHGTAVGHMNRRGGDPQPFPFWSLPHALAPAGALLAMNPRGLLAFGADLAGHHKLLSAETVEQAWTPYVEVPDIGALGTHWGLGWMLFDWPGARVVGHDGTTVGQSSQFRLLPDAGIALVSLANGGRAAGFHRAVARHVLRATGGVDVPPPVVAPGQRVPVDALRYAGRYDSSSMSLVIQVRPDGTAVAVESALTPEARSVWPEVLTTELVTLDGERLIATEATTGIPTIFAFRGGPGKPATHVFRGGRLTARTGDVSA